VLALLFSATSCSLLVDNHADQCASDLECARFSGTFCDLGVRLCKPIILASEASTTFDAGSNEDAGELVGSSADACSDRKGFENACTNAACKPFDNRLRLKRLPLDGGLTPLPPPREAGSLDAAKDSPAMQDAGSGDAARDVAAIGVGVDDGSKNESFVEDAGKDGD